MTARYSGDALATLGFTKQLYGPAMHEKRLIDMLDAMQARAARAACARCFPASAQ